MSRGRGHREPYYKFLKRLRENRRDGKNTYQETTPMPQDQTTYSPPPGRPRATPPEHLSELLPFPTMAKLADLRSPHLALLKAADDTAPEAPVVVAPAKKAYSEERCKAMALGQIARARKSYTVARREARRRNLTEQRGRWMTHHQMGVLFEIGFRSAAARARKSGWPIEFIGDVKPVAIYLVPNEALPVTPLADAPPAAPAVAPQQLPVDDVAIPAFTPPTLLGRFWARLWAWL